MKALLRVVLLLGIGLLVLAACSPAASTSPDESVSATDDGGLYPEQDLSLISNTGRPQFIHSYADWCTTCQHNHPIVNKFMTEFGDQVDFIHLDIETTDTIDARMRFDIVERSQYLLTDAQGVVLQRWYGILDEATVESYIRDYLATQA